MLVEKIFLSLLFLIPIIGLYSGLSVAGTVPVFLLSCLFYVRKFLEFRIRDNKLEIIFIFIQSKL